MILVFLLAIKSYLQVKRQNTTFCTKGVHYILRFTGKKETIEYWRCIWFPIKTDAFSLESYRVFLPVQTSFLILPFFHFSKSPPFPHPRSKTVISLFFCRTLSINSPRKIKSRSIYTHLCISLILHTKG